MASQTIILQYFCINPPENYDITSFRQEQPPTTPIRTTTPPPRTTAAPTTPAYSPMAPLGYPTPESPRDYSPTMPPYTAASIHTAHPSSSLPPEIPSPSASAALTRSQVHLPSMLPFTTSSSTTNAQPAAASPSIQIPGLGALPKTEMSNLSISDDDYDYYQDGDGDGDTHMHSKAKIERWDKNNEHPIPSVNILPTIPDEIVLIYNAQNGVVPIYRYYM